MIRCGMATTKQEVLVSVRYWQTQEGERNKKSTLIDAPTLTFIVWSYSFTRGGTVRGGWQNKLQATQPTVPPNHRAPDCRNTCMYVSTPIAFFVIITTWTRACPVCQVCMYVCNCTGTLAVRVSNTYVKSVTTWRNAQSLLLVVAGPRTPFLCRCVVSWNDYG